MGRHSSTPKSTRQYLIFALIVSVIGTTLAVFHLVRYVMMGFWILVFIGVIAVNIWYGFFCKDEPEEEIKCYSKIFTKEGHVFKFNIYIGYRSRYGRLYCLYEKIIDGIAYENWTSGSYDFDKECNERIEWFLKTKSEEERDNKYLKERVNYLVNNGFEKI